VRSLRPITIPFANGASGQADSKLLPNGLFESVVNARFRRDGALRPRRGYEVVSDPDTLVSPRDLYSFGDSVYALAGSSTTATDLYVKVAEDGDVWRPLSDPAEFGFGQLSGVEDLLATDDCDQIPFDVHTAVASAGGVTYVGLSYRVASGGQGRHRVVIANADTRAIVYDETFLPDTGVVFSGLVAMPASGTSAVFGHAMVQTNAVYRAITISQDGAVTVGAPVTLATNFFTGFTMRVWGDGTHLFLVWRRTSGQAIRFQRFDADGDAVGSAIELLTDTSDHWAFAHNADSSRFALAVQASATNVRLVTFSTTTVLDGPDNITVATMNTNRQSFALYFSSSTNVALLTTEDADPGAIHVTVRNSTLGEAASFSFHGFDCTGYPVVDRTAGRVYLPCAHRAWRTSVAQETFAAIGANAVLSFDPVDGSLPRVELYSDVPLAGDAVGRNPAHNATAFVGGKLYWAALRAVSPITIAATVRRADARVFSRRPAAQLGNLLYFAGGSAMATEGQRLVEVGMPPPLLVSATQGTTGSLTQGGTYKYRAHWEWRDRLGNLHVSPVSDEFEVELTGTNDSVAFEVGAPPTLRAYPPGAPMGDVRLKLFRTETAVSEENTPAVATGGPVNVALTNGTGLGLDAIENLAAVPFGGGALTVTVDGGSPVTIDFPSGVIGLVEVVDTLNTALSGVATVTVQNGNRLVFTTTSEGSSSAIEFGGGTRLRQLLGLVGVSAEGTTTTTSEPGELFYLTATDSLGDDSAEYGETFTISDTTSDADLIERETIYTTGDRGAVSGLLDSAIPAASDFAAATRDRVALASTSGLVQVSQRLFPNEAVMFVEPGLVGPVGFAYQARIEEEITGLAALDDSLVIGTRDAIYVMGGEGPNYVGAGEFTVPLRLPGETGLYDWRSMVESSEGLWFQGQADKLYLLPRGGGVPALVRDVPAQSRITINAAVASGTEPSGVDDEFGPCVTFFGEGFAIDAQSTGLVRDIARGLWITDDYGDVIGTPTAAVAHRGVVYLTNGTTVYRERSDGVCEDAGEAFAAQVTTGVMHPFGPNGWGRVGRIVVLCSGGPAADGAVLEVEQSFDDGETWTSIAEHTFTSDAETGGETQIEIAPAEQRCSSLKLRFTITPAATGYGIDIHGFTLWVKPSSGPVRLDSTVRY
jgi:hypothetical protein